MTDHRDSLSGDVIYDDDTTFGTAEPKPGNVRREYGDKLGYHERPYDALVDADALLVMTEWKESPAQPPKCCDQRTRLFFNAKPRQAKRLLIR